MAADQRTDLWRCFGGLRGVHCVATSSLWLSFSYTGNSPGSFPLDNPILVEALGVWGESTSATTTEVYWILSPPTASTRSCLRRMLDADRPHYRDGNQDGPRRQQLRLCQFASSEAARSNWRIRKKKKKKKNQSLLFRCPGAIEISLTVVGMIHERMVLNTNVSGLRREVVTGWKVVTDDTNILMVENPNVPLFIATNRASILTNFLVLGRLDNTSRDSPSCIWSSMTDIHLLRREVGSGHLVRSAGVGKEGSGRETLRPNHRYPTMLLMDDSPDRRENSVPSGLYVLIHSRAGPTQTAPSTRYSR